MEGKGRLSGHILNMILTAALCLMTIGCSKRDETPTEMLALRIDLDEGELISRAAPPDENKITDVNLLVFDRYGTLERHLYSHSQERSFRLELIKGEEYSFCALVNFGQRVQVGNFSDLQQLRFHLAYPDEYKEGIPMYAFLDRHTVGSSDSITLSLVRLMAKISIRIDRSRLSEGVTMNITGLRIGNCPKVVSVLGDSRAGSSDDCFHVGFSLSGGECHPLNRSSSGHTSLPVSLYMLENMQGKMPENITDDRQKVFQDTNGRSQVCSYIEIEMDYSSQTWQSGNTPLIYRFYLGEDRNSLDIERNCHYHITVCPEDDGLRGDGWRVDKTGLEYIGETALVQYPGDYIVGNIGDKIHIGCILTPDHAPFDVGIDYMEDDRKEGIYEYEIDADGHGAVLTLTGPGSGLIYMKAGAPINGSALFLIEVNQPR